MIRAKNLCIGYTLRRGEKKVVNQSLEFSLKAGELTCLMGLNGAGKSTLIKTLCGTILPLSGSIEVSGEIGLVLTEKTNAGGLSVYELISLGRYRHTGIFGQLTKKDDEIVKKSMKAVGIERMSESFLSELSDGEKQKAFIAKALAQECQVIILDEPTAFLDVKSKKEVMELLCNLAHLEKKAVMLSTHDLDLALKYADSMLLLAKSGPLLKGAPEDLTASGTIDSFFG